MRIDPKISDHLDRLGGGASDAARGQQAAAAGDAVQDEAAFEPLDSLLRNRLAASSLQDSASSVTSAADVQALADRTAELLRGSADLGRAAQGNLAADRLRDLLAD